MQNASTENDKLKSPPAPASAEDAALTNAFDVAEEIRRLCEQANSLNVEVHSSFDAASIAASPASNPHVDCNVNYNAAVAYPVEENLGEEKILAPIPEPVGAETVGRSGPNGSVGSETVSDAPVSQASAAGPESPVFELLAPNFLQQIATDCSKRARTKVAIVVASQSGNVVESGQSGWRSSDFRLQSQGLALTVRENVWANTTTTTLESIVPPPPQTATESDTLESPPVAAPPNQITQLQSVVLASFAKSINTPHLISVPIRLPETNAMLLVIASVDSVETAVRFEHAVRHYMESLVPQLDAWLMIRRCRRFAKWTNAWEWIKANPKWCAAPVAVALLLLLLPIPYYPKRECVLEPEAKRYVASPIQGRIASCDVRPGMEVHEGDLLAKIDDDQLRRDLATAQAELESAQQKSHAALATKASSNYSLATLEHEQAKLKIESIQNQLQRLEIRTPVSGVVILGDWHKNVGMPVTLGQNLFEVAELESMVAEVHLQPDDLSHISVGDEVTVHSDATGFQSFHGKISRIEPRATVVDDQAIFVADVVIRDPGLKLRPGMKATSHISAGWKTLAWVLFSRPARWLSHQWIW